MSGYHGKGGKRKRGAHRNRRSPETLRWNADHLIPSRPPWMDPDTYAKLAQLRTELQRA